MAMGLKVLLAGMVATVIIGAGAVQAQEMVDTSKIKVGADGKPLTAMQSYVTLHDGTEPPFKNAYWNNHREGIYVDVISGKPLFSSTDKFDSGTGWPSFTKPLDPTIVKYFDDESVGMSRTAVTSDAGTHLGHKFEDGPKEAGGVRFCINSAALKFIPKEDMEAKGYGKWMYLFKK